MSGKEKGTTNVRTPRAPQDSARASLERRFSDAVDLIEKKPADAIRAFTLMQVEALSVSPQLAAALGDAIESFRKGRDATTPLLRARCDKWCAHGFLLIESPSAGQKWV